jgi:hypothetical protein
MQDLNANLYKKYTSLKVPPPNSSLASLPYPWISQTLSSHFSPFCAAVSFSQKRKLLDDGAARGRDSDIKEMCQGKSNPDCLLSRQGLGFFLNLDFVIWIMQP